MLTFKKKSFISVVMKYLLCIFLGFILSIVMIITVVYIYNKGYEDGYYTHMAQEVQADVQEVLKKHKKSW